jgi:guanylate kinase
MKQGVLILFAAHSGAGKTTIIRQLLQRHPDWFFSVSVTTRKPRPGEVDGQDYHFVSKDVFQTMIREKQLLEYEEVHGEFYGTPAEPVRKALENGKVCIFDLDVKGVMSIQRQYPEQSLSIFIEVPDMNLLRERLINRKTETPEEIEKRLSRISLETAMKDAFDEVVVNDQLEKAVHKTETLIKQIKERC